MVQAVASRLSVAAPCRLLVATSQRRGSRTRAGSLQIAAQARKGLAELLSLSSK
jgi:hypothetical protein